MPHTDRLQPQPAATSGKRRLTAQEVADALSVSRDHVYDLANTGVFTKHYIGKATKYYRIDPEEVDAYLASRPTEPVDEDGAA